MAGVIKAVCAVRDGVRPATHRFPRAVPGPPAGCLAVPDPPRGRTAARRGPPGRRQLLRCQWHQRPRSCPTTLVVLPLSAHDARALIRCTEALTNLLDGAGRPRRPAAKLPDRPAYPQIMAVFAAAEAPLRARGVCEGRWTWRSHPPGCIPPVPGVVGLPTPPR
ncbi:hypothetical protein [Streptomyces sp. NPDC054804]